MKHIDVKNRNVAAELSPTEKRIRQLRLKRFLRKNDPKFIDQEMVAKANEKKLRREWSGSKSHRYLKCTAFSTERSTRHKKPLLLK